MKIAQILPRMNIGGVERGVIDSVKYFKNTEVGNIVVSGGGRLTEELKKNGIKHYTMPVYKKSPFSLFLIPGLRKIMAVENIDIIHARSRVPAWISFFASRTGNAHFITTAHGVYKNKLWSEVMGWGKFVICPSKIVARHMRENFGVPEEKIAVVNRWVDLNRFKFSGYETRKKNNVIVSIGRIAPNKGYEYLIEALKKVVRANPYVKLKIVGSPDKTKMKYFKYLKTLVNRFSLDYNVEFTGFRDDVENVLKEARILVAPSIADESFGRVIVEAFACGVPVIATRIGGFNEIIEENKDGIMVDPKNSEAIGSGIIEILNDNKLAEGFVINAREKVNRLYSMDNCLEETKKVYRRTIETLRILVIKISSLGDVILSIPALKEIRERFPQANVCLLTLKKYSSLLYDCPYVDEIITVNENYKKFKEILNVTTGLRRKTFDYIIDLQNNRASHLISFLAFPRNSFGYSLRWGFLLRKKIKYNRRDSPLASQERVLELLGIRFNEKKLVFWKQKNAGTADILPDANMIGINISASSRWESKNWPFNNIVQLSELIHKNMPSFRIVLFGDGDAVKYAGKIEAMLGPRAVNLCGKSSLKELPALISRMKVFITPDTATLHLAEAVGVPVIAFFGPTDPSRHTVESKNLYVFCRELPCSFCYMPVCKRSPKNLCMEKITPQEVFSKIKEIVNMA